MPFYDTAYLALNALILPAWAMLLLAPRARITRNLVHSGLMPLLLGTLYAAFLIAGVFFGKAAPGAGMADLAGVTALFSHPNGILTGWTHFVVFDLFVGAWVARDAARSGISHLASVPALVLALVFGPLGLMLHLIVRGVTTDRGFSLNET